MTWASNPLDAPVSDMIAAVRMGITIESIATPRAMLVVRQKRHWPGFASESEIKGFDHVPVTEDDKIVGVFDRESGSLRELSETMFMASDASLLSFVQNADQRRFAFVVRESQIAGIVTLSDIQKLPVYCVLFSLLISIEVLLTEWIRKVCRDQADKWLIRLNNGAKRRIEGYWKKAQVKNVALDKLSYASFLEKLTAAKGMGLFSSNESASVSLERLNELRNLVCHGKEIAHTPDRALKLPAHVRDALGIQVLLEQELRELPA